MAAWLMDVVAVIWNMPQEALVFVSSRGGSWLHLGACHSRSTEHRNSRCQRDGLPPVFSVEGRQLRVEPVGKSFAEVLWRLTNSLLGESGWTPIVEPVGTVVPTDRQKSVVKHSSKALHQFCCVCALSGETNGQIHGQLICQTLLVHSGITTLLVNKGLKKQPQKDGV